MNVCKYKHSTQYTLELNGLENGLDIIRWSKYINIHNAPFFVAPKSTFSYGSPTIKGPQWMKFQATSGRWMTP